jgi:putative ABC transport system substrate-binding protein
MKKFIALLLLSLSLFFCGKKNHEDLYTIGIFQFNDAPHLNDVRKGVIQALWDNGFQDGVNIQLEIRNGNGSTPEVQRIAQEFVEMEVDMIVALSTPCLQAALIATHEIPIIFSSVANPYLAGAGRSSQNHMRTVTGVASRGPIRESLMFIKETIPGAKRLGTLWTPSEINSEFYLELAREEGKKVGLEIVDVPIANKSQVLHSAQVLINESFQDVGTVAGENSVPLFGGFLLSTRLGACAALGWDFSEMGYTTGEMAIRVKNGENPADIPIQSMSKVRIHLNLRAAEKQGIEFSDEFLNKADEILELEENSQFLSDS